MQPIRMKPAWMIDLLKISARYNCLLYGASDKIPPKAKVITHGYNVRYLKYGFTSFPQDDRLPLCVIRKKSFSNEAMNLSGMKDNLHRIHPDKKNADVEYFNKLQFNFKAYQSICSPFKRVMKLLLSLRQRGNGIQSHGISFSRL